MSHFRKTKTNMATDKSLNKSSRAGVFVNKEKQSGRQIIDCQLSSATEIQQSHDLPEFRRSNGSPMI